MANESSPPVASCHTPIGLPVVVLRTVSTTTDDFGSCRCTLSPPPTISLFSLLLFVLFFSSQLPGSLSFLLMPTFCRIADLYWHRIFCVLVVTGGMTSPFRARWYRHTNAFIGA